MLMMLNRLEAEMTVYAESDDDDQFEKYSSLGWLQHIYNTSLPLSFSIGTILPFSDPPSLGPLLGPQWQWRMSHLLSYKDVPF